MKTVSILLLLLVMIQAKSIPSAFARQDDIVPSERGDSSAIGKLLIVSRAGEFKNAIISEVADSLESHSLYIQIEGIRYLKDLDPSAYHSILIINTCMAWQIDNKVQTFLRDNPNYSSLVLLTTSADPVSCGKGRHIPKNIDAISSASASENISPTTAEVLKELRKYLQ